MINQPPRRPDGLPVHQVWMWPPPAAPFGTWARPTGPVRIGDAERDSAVSALGDHFAAGRLTRDEFDERIDKAMQARFQSDLQPLFADLPGPAVERPPAAGWPTGPPPRVPVFLLFLPVLIVALIVTAIALGAPWMLWGMFWLFILSRFWARHPTPRGHRRRW
jgi:Domain of unknown function (DUF1707)